MPLHFPYFRQAGGLILSIMLLACQAETLLTEPIITPTALMAVSTPPPDYPAELGCMGIGGTVLLKVTIGLEGTISDTVLLNSSDEALLDEAAMTGIQSWQFRPATRNGQAIPATIHIPVRFNPPTLKPDWCFAMESMPSRA